MDTKLCYIVFSISLLDLTRYLIVGTHKHISLFSYFSSLSLFLNFCLFNKVSGFPQGTIEWVSQPLPWLEKKEGHKNDPITNWTSEEFGNRNQNIHTHKDTQISAQIHT